MRASFVIYFVALAICARADWPFPNSDGTVWNYSLQREPDEDAVPFSRQIFAPEKSDDKANLRIETQIDGTLRSTEFLKNVGNAVFATAHRAENGGTEAFEPPMTILPADLQFGVEWDYRGLIAGIDLTLRLKFTGEGEVEVPAGKFRAFHIRGEQNAGVGTIADLWFVHGVGWVKEMVTQRSPSGDLLSRSTIELVKLPISNDAAPTPEPKKLEASVSTSSDGDPLRSISADALQIVARWQGHALRKNAKIRAVWIAEDTGGVAPPEFKVDEATAIASSPEAFGKFTLSRPADGWASGKYRVEFYVDKELVSTASVIIAPPPPQPSPSALDF